MNMPVTNLTKKQKKHLRELAETAYERDLARSLESVASKFDAWKKNEISVWDLNQDIHEFHNKIARDLYKSYTMVDTELSVAFGIVQGVITLEEVDVPCRDRILSLSKAISQE
jgi:hypothetical protein